MAKNITILEVFASSPSDVSAERAELERVISELNLIWANTLGVRLDLLQWRTHAHPGLGLDAQDLINKQIGDEYDLFIGIMWARFGQPTPRAGSGTEEEFNRALSRAQTSRGAKIMFYFKNDPIPISDIDSDQLAKVVAFKKRLQSVGVLYSEFTGPFDDFVRLHLSRELQDWIKSGGPAISSAPEVEEKKTDASDALPSQADDEDAAILDNLADYQENIAAAVASQSRLGTAIEILGTQLTARGAEVDDATSKGNIDYKIMRDLANRAAEDIEHFVEEMQPETISFGDQFRGALHALSYVVAHADEAPKFNTLDLRETLTSLKNQITTNIVSNVSFKESFVKMPKLTKRFNLARRRAEAVLDRLGEEMRLQASLIQQILDSLPDGADQV